VAGSSALQVVRIWTGGSMDDEQGTPGSAEDQDPLLKGADALDQIESTATAASAEQMLSAGIHDVTETLTSEFALNDLLQMVLETMYRGMGFTRTIIFVRDAKQNTMRARFGFGADIEEVIAKCTFPLAFAPDVFHVALDKGADIAIENTQAANIVQRIPEWHRKAMQPNAFLLLPVILKNRPLALLYADFDRTDAAKISAEQLNLLRTLRSQVVLAFKHCAS
jgi:transcriptional regulator with GAF, ATPase, and Fis domain